MATVLSLVSGKGGTGKSTAAVGLSRALAQSGRRTLVCDLDIGLPCLDLLMGLSDRVIFDWGDILAGRCTPQGALVEDASGACLLPSPAVPPKDFSLAKLADLLRSFKDDFDYILLDTPAGLGLSVVLSRMLSDLCVAVTLLDPVSLRDVQKLTHLLEAPPVRLLVNRLSRDSLRRSGHPDLDAVMDACGLPLLGVLPEDADLLCHKTPHPVFAAMADRLAGKQVPLILDRI